MIPVERTLLAAFTACWAVVVLDLAGILPLHGRQDLSLYALYGTAAALGWVAGNVWIARTRAGRRRGADPLLRRRLLFLWLLGPPSLVTLLRAMASPDRQLEAPLAALWAFGVYVIFFMVPVSFAPERTRGRG
jgi:hypothetical protein